MRGVVTALDAGSNQAARLRLCFRGALPPFYKAALACLDGYCFKLTGRRHRGA